MSKKFVKALRPGIQDRRTGFLGMGRKIEVSGGGLKYTVDRRAANADMAATLNRKIPMTTFRKPL